MPKQILRMMLLMFLIFTIPGYSRCKIMNDVILETISRRDTSVTIQPQNDEEITLHKENKAENGELTRHMSNTKLLEQKLKENCSNIQTKECEQILKDLVYAHSTTKRKSHFFRNAFEKFNFRFCLDGFEIVQIDPETQICCNGVFNRTSGSEECCQGEIIDNKEQLCCNENVQNRTDFYSCCGIYTYDVRLQTCCDGNLYLQSEGTACCGSHVYNKETEKCCFNIYKFKLSDGDACCGDSIYNSSTHTCCHRTIHQAFGKKNRNGGCCKDKNFHQVCYKCENNTIIPIYDEATSLCCDGKIRYKKHGNDTECCGRQVFDSTKYHCDNGMKKYTPTISTTDKGRQNIVDINKTTSVLVTSPDNDISKDNSDKKFKTVYVLVPCGALLSVAVFIVAYTCCGASRIRRKKMSESNLYRYTYNGSNSVITDEQQPFLNNLPHSYNAYTNINGNGPRESITLRFNSSENQTLDDDIIFGTVENRNLANESLLSNISKEGSTIVPTENELMFYSKDSFTQTCPEKESNQRTIFGKPFDHNFILGESKATAEMPSSDVKMTLPVSVLKSNKIEVNCTSFTSIVSLRKKLGLSYDRALASPVVEYTLTGYGQLNDYAVVLLPFIGNPENLEVRKFDSDEGLNTVVKSNKVPKQTKVNEDLDVFYILKDCHVYVYTKSFSGFYCTTMRHRSLRLRSFLFGSYKRFVDPLRHEVRVMIYIADELLKFADYKERMLTNESAEGRMLKKEMLLKVPHELTENDIVQFAITPTESHCNQWMHKLYPGESYPIYDEIQRVELYHIAEKCKECEHCHLPEHDIPHSIEWYLTNVPDVIPSYTFQCIVDIDVIKTTNEVTTTNRIVIDELQLRQEDRCHVGDTFNARNVQGVKEYLATSVTSAEREHVLSSLASKYNSPGRSVEEVFFKLQEKLTPKYVLEAVTTILKEKQMFEQLDCLHAWGYIPRNFITTNMQPVFEDLVGATVDPSPHIVNINIDPSNNLVPHTLQYQENLMDDAQGIESHKHTKTTSDTTTRNDRMVRQELSQTANMDDDITGKGEIEKGEVHGELSTRLRHCDSKDEKSDAPIQEHASLDDTNLKT